MGCDGGTIPKRDELVKTKKKPEQKDKSAELAYRWKHCAVSQEPLQKPVVACELGRLYNKDTIIETLLDKSAPSVELISHVKNLRDVKEITLTENPSWIEADATEKGDAYIDNHKAKWICPVIGHEMNGRFRFVLIWTCGCVFSEKALKEMNKSKKEEAKHSCLSCQKAFDMNDVVLLNPEDEDLVNNQVKMEKRRSIAKDQKKSKKEKKNGSSSSTTTASKNEDSLSLPSSKVSEVDNSNKDKDLKRKLNIEKPKSGSTIKPEELPTSSKKLRNELSKTEFKESKISSDYSIANDSKASSTYKSLFSTCDAAKEKAKTAGPWVTYNPFYN